MVLPLPLSVKTVLVVVPVPADKVTVRVAGVLFQRRPRR